MKITSDYYKRIVVLVVKKEAEKLQPQEVGEEKLVLCSVKRGNVQFLARNQKVAPEHSLLISKKA